MNTDDVLKIVLREMRAYGQAWRIDWYDFDGRQLRDQLDGIAEWAENPTEDYTEGTEFLKYKNDCYDE